ncbi:MAG TPA: exodeoxyribonuclease VII small subunit [Thermodesulfobacteriaceae bacterium]|nr:exodeoxyribonuclease VII small subunit [Thermodesulfobacteriaceae bacterium]
MIKELDFETALKELEKRVNELENDDLSLEDALKTFEEGIKLSRHCAGCLSIAEKRIQELTIGNDNQPEIKAFDDSGD